ncbi:MAG: glutaredoxin family protein [Candidatus Acidiferrales bacterium]
MNPSAERQMNPIGKRILALFDELERDSLDLHTLLEFIGGNPPAEREAVFDSVAQLIREGLLKPGEGGDFYQRTEDGRLAAAGPREVTLYTRANCHLCEEAKAAMAPALREFSAKLHEVDIDRDETLRARYTNDVPVIFIGPRKVAKHRLDAAEFRRQLERSGA